MTLLEKYIDELDVTMSKDRLKNTMRSLYTVSKNGKDRFLMKSRIYSQSQRSSG